MLFILRHPLPIAENSSCSSAHVKIIDRWVLFFKMIQTMSHRQLLVIVHKALQTYARSPNLRNERFRSCTGLSSRSVSLHYAHLPNHSKYQHLQLLLHAANLGLIYYFFARFMHINKWDQSRGILQCKIWRFDALEGFKLFFFLFQNYYPRISEVNIAVFSIFSLLSIE